MSDAAEELPAGWDVTSLGEVAQIDLGKMLDRKQTAGTPQRYLRNINVRWGRIDLTDLLEMPFKPDELSRFSIRDEDVLVCEGGEPGRAAVWRFGNTEVRYQKALHRVRLHADIGPDWLVYHLMHDAWTGQLAKRLTGTTIGHLPREVFVEHPLRVAPLAEQRRIVEGLDTLLTRLDATVATLKRVERNLKRYRASVLKAAVEGLLVPTEAELARREGRSFEPASELLERILTERRRRWEEAELARLSSKGKAPTDTHWNSKYVEPSEPESAGNDNLPEGWCWSALAQLCDSVTDGDHLPPPQSSTGVPFLVIGNVRTGEVTFDGSRFVSPEYFEQLDPRRKPRCGDVLYTVTGSFGIPVHVRSNRPFCVQRHIAILRPSPTVSADLVVQFLGSNLAFRQADAMATGTAQKTVPLQLLRRMVLPLPPLAEQSRIVPEVSRLLSVADAVTETVASELARCTRLRQSILKAAFEGKLVDQDPSDKPASVLLERIRAERAASAEAGAKRPRRAAKRDPA